MITTINEYKKIEQKYKKGYIELRLPVLFMCIKKCEIELEVETQIIIQSYSGFVKR